MNSTLPAVVFLVPFAGALATGAAGWFRPRCGPVIALASLATSAAGAWMAVIRSASEGTLVTWMGGWAPPFGVEWRLDTLGALTAAAVATVATLQYAGLRGILRAELGDRETGFTVCTLLLVSGLLGLLCSADLFNVFVHLEVASLSAYALVAAGGRGAPRAAMRYLVSGSLGASLYLLGVGHIYAATGTLNMADAAMRLRALADPTLGTLGLVLITCGLGVKMGAFPLHGWMLGAYSRAPLTGSALMAPIVTKTCAFVLIRILFWVGGLTPAVSEALIWIGAAGLALGAVQAARETDFRRLLAYSSASQMGLVVVGIGFGTSGALTGAILHIANDAVMKAALFAAAAVVAHRFGVHDVTGLSQVRGRAPWTAGVIAVAMLSLVGFPPLCGFFGKWYVLTAAIDAGRPAVAAAVAAGGLASALYAFRVLEALFLRPAAEPVPLHREGPGPALAACAVFAAGVVALGLGAERVVSLLIRPSLPGGM